MNSSTSNNSDLIKRYPFIPKILSIPMEPYDGQSGTSVHDLTICVKKADEDLMFRQAKNTGLGDSLFSFQLSDRRKDQVMRCGEYLFAIDGNGQIVNRVNWPRNEEDYRKNIGEIYGCSIFLTGLNSFPNDESCYINSICDKVKQLVWVTVEEWYIDTKNYDEAGDRFGDFQERSIHLTIYEEPDQGFEKLQKEASIYTNLSLNNQMINRGVTDKNHDIISIGGMLKEMCLTFRDEVYFNGMSEILKSEQFHEVFGQFGTVKMSCIEIFGHEIVTLKDNLSYVHLQLHPNSKHLCVLGIQGTLPQIRNLVRTVVQMWREHPELRAAFKSNMTVSVMW